jgi:hypothetical protein
MRRIKEKSVCVRVVILTEEGVFKNHNIQRNFIIDMRKSDENGSCICFLLERRRKKRVKVKENVEMV